MFEQSDDNRKVENIDDYRTPIDDNNSFWHSKADKTEDDGESNWLVSYADMMTLLVGFFVMLQSFSKPDTQIFEKMKQETTKVFGGEYTIPFEQLYKKMDEIVKSENLSDQVKFQVTDEGIVLTFRGALFFDSGSVELKNQASQLLEKLVPKIYEQANAFNIVIEGHTDNVPISGGIIKSNWELSSLRACTVLRFFQEQGFEESKLSAIGWGDTKPLLNNLDEQGNPIPENQAQNRRVVVRILNNMNIN